jgi:hypothetical protein
LLNQDKTRQQSNPKVPQKSAQNPLSIQKSAPYNPSTANHPKIEENIFFENIGKKFLIGFCLFYVSKSFNAIILESLLEIFFLESIMIIY